MNFKNCIDALGKVGQKYNNIKARDFRKPVIFLAIYLHNQI